MVGLGAWEGDFEELESHVEDLASGPELCERVFASKHEALMAGRYLADAFARRPTDVSDLPPRS